LFGFFDELSEKGHKRKKILVKAWFLRGKPLIFAVQLENEIFLP